MLRPNRDERLRPWQVVTATLWPLATCVAWLWSTRWASLQGDYEAALTAAALVALAISWAVRYFCGAAGSTPARGGERVQSNNALGHNRDATGSVANLASAANAASAVSAADAADAGREFVWLAAWLGQIFALGSIALLLPSLAACSPAFLMSAVIEGCALNRAPLRWRRSCQSLFGQLPPLHGARAPATCELQGSPKNHSITSSASSADALVRHRDFLSSTENFGDQDSFESDLQACQRQSMEECSEDGLRSLSGWIRFRLETGQKTQSVIVGFCPAFEQCPEVDVELMTEPSDDLAQNEMGADFATKSLSGLGAERSMNEEDHDGCETHIEHVTPAGMRVILKRRTTNELSFGKLLWHASLTPASDRDDWLVARLKGQLP